MGPLRIVISIILTLTTLGTVWEPVSLFVYNVKELLVLSNMRTSHSPTLPCRDRDGEPGIGNCQEFDHWSFKSWCSVMFDLRESWRNVGSVSIIYTVNQVTRGECNLSIHCYCTSIISCDVHIPLNLISQKSVTTLHTCLNIDIFKIQFRWDILWLVKDLILEN